MSTSRRVAITGIGLVTPLGVGGASHWENLVAGRSAVRRIDRLARLGFPCEVAAEISPESIAACLPRLSRKQLKLYNRATTLAMSAAILAAEDAGIQAPVPDPVRAGVILATLFIPYPIQSLLPLLPDVESSETANQADMGKALKRCMGGVNPLDLSLKIVPNLTAGHIAITYALRGACRTVADAWIGGMQAIGQAVTAIREGDLDLVFCGGAECPLEDLVYADLCSTDLLARPNGVPERTCQPFGRQRRGTVAGEGAAVLILEALDHAERRGARIRSEITGFGSASGEPTPDGYCRTLGRAMRGAMAETGRDRIAAISLHGDAGPVSDLGEAMAVRELSRSWGTGLPAYATKGAHGNLFSAAAPVEVASAALALGAQTLPPSRNCDDMDPACDLAVHATSRPLAADTILVNALGCFGEAAALVVAKV
jgi:3-oxoacyl-[acyl-carrier-protein] synthase II